MSGGVREVGVRLKVGADGTESIARLGAALKTLGVDTAELDRQAEELSGQLVKTGTAGAGAAIDQDKLAEASAEASKAAKALADAAKDAAGGTGALGETGATAAEKLAAMKVELAAAGATVYAIGRALGTAAKDASGFEDAMAEVATLVDDTSGMDDQAAAVRRLAIEYGGDAQSQAKALYQIISAGAAQGTAAIGLLDQANKLAVGGVTDIKTAADGLTSVINAYGASAGTAAQVSDALFVAMRAGKTTVGELNSNIGQVAPIAAQAGVGLDELLAGTAALTKGGVSTSQAMTQLRAIVQGVIAPTAEAQRVAQSLGLQFDATALKAKGLSGFLDAVRQATGGNAETVAKLFGSVEALGGVLALTGEQASSFSDTLEKMDRRAGATDEAVAKIASTSGQAGRQFAAALADVRISVGQSVTAFTPLVRVASELLGVFNSLPTPLQTGVSGAVALGVAIGPLTLAVGSLTKAAGLLSTALGLKARAAAAVVAPAAAAAGATAAMGTAAAAATPAIGAAAAATTLLGRAMLALKAALPIGLILTVAGLATEFFRARKEAEDADKAVRKMLEGPASPALPKAAKDAADATKDLAGAAQDSEAKLKAQAGAARLAAEALGVDLARSAGEVSKEFELKLKRLDDLITGLGALKRQGVETGTLVADALGKMIDSAKNTQEFDALRAKIVQLGTEGEISEDKLTELMAALEKGAKKAAGEVDQLAEAYKRLGVSSVQDLKRIADENRKAWELIRNDTGASLEIKQKAFQRYAESAIAANSGVAESTLKTEAKALGLESAFDSAGKAVVRLAEKAKPALDSVAGQVSSVTSALDKMVEAAGIGVETYRKWAEQVDANALRGRTAAEASSLAREGGLTRTVSTGQATNRPDGDGWYYTLDQYKIRRYGTDAQGRPLPGGWARDDSTASITDPRASITPAGSRRGTSPFGSAGASASPLVGQLELQAALATQAAAAATPSQVVEIRFAKPGSANDFISVTAPNRAQADALVALLRDEMERSGRGSGG